jgi:hypothetical protein
MGSSPDRAPAVGSLARGQEIVIADVTGSALADVFEVLSHTELARRARWVALLGDELVFVFDGNDPVQPATDLLAILAGARLATRRATVTQVMRAEDLVEQAQRTSPAARRARMARDAHEEPQ